MRMTQKERNLVIQKNLMIQKERNLVIQKNIKRKKRQEQESNMKRGEMEVDNYDLARGLVHHYIYL